MNPTNGAKPTSTAVAVFCLTMSMLAVFAHTSMAEQAEVTMTNPVDGYELVYIPEGEFMMGSPDDYGRSDEHPRHKVYLDGYYIGKYEVTVAQFRKYCNDTGLAMPDQEGHADNCPAINISYDDATAYAKWAEMRLPTEAEWEKAARAGSDTQYWWGDVYSHEMANYKGVGGRDHWSNVSPVGKFPANNYGLFDTAGNVWEWCADWYDANYYKTSPNKNPKGPKEGDYKVSRGGSWLLENTYMRSAYRFDIVPKNRYPYNGFRCAKDK